METIKTGRGRATACQHHARPRQDRLGVEPRTMLADGWPHGPKEWLLTAFMALTMTGILPMLAAAFLIWLLEPVPSWAIIGGFMAAMIGAAAWAWRAL